MNIENLIADHENWLWIISIFVLPYVVAELALFFTVLVKSNRYWSSDKKKLQLSDNTPLAPISVLVPAFNEEKVVVEAIKSILKSGNSETEVIVINDGSTDNTIEVLKNSFELVPAHHLPRDILSSSPVKQVLLSKTYPNLKVIDKLLSGKGKADALNTGIGYARNELVCVVDADSMLEADSLKRLSQPFKANPETVAVGGAVRCGNSRKKILPFRGFNPLIWAQDIEYARIFYMDRVVLSSFNLNYIISGAFGMFRRTALLAVGGYRSNLAEDMDLTLRLHRYFREANVPYSISHAPKATCWTEVPFNLEIFKKQRSRWHAGFVQGVLGHLDIVGHKKFGGFGKVILPYCSLTLLEPFFVAMSLMLTITGLMLPEFKMPIILAFIGAHVLFSLTYLQALVLLERQNDKPSRGRVARDYICWLLFGKFFDGLSFVLRLFGFLKFFRKETSWGKMERRGMVRDYKITPTQTISSKRVEA
ncbi:MAG: glycosyltransferase family 2 protein [Pseudobacteriovorax sp.]|nr:glycosyltransferase family 2 protein [Pseudobacteriovorax sp.]